MVASLQGLDLKVQKMANSNILLEWRSIRTIFCMSLIWAIFASKYFKQVAPLFARLDVKDPRMVSSMGLVGSLLVQTAFFTLPIHSTNGFKSFVFRITTWLALENLFPACQSS